MMLGRPKGLNFSMLGHIGTRTLTLFFVCLFLFCSAWSRTEALACTRQAFYHELNSQEYFTTELHPKQCWYVLFIILCSLTINCSLSEEPLKLLKFSTVSRDSLAETMAAGQVVY